MSIKVAQNELTGIMKDHLHKSCLKMWAIWAKQLLPHALKNCTKCNKSPNLVNTD